MSDLRVLIVDDSITIRRIILNTLKTIGISEAIEAVNGTDALEKLGAGNVNFIITDWNMPSMNGLEFTKSVRNTAAISDIPILMITTRGSEADVIEALKARVNSYIVKPFTPTELKGKIEEALSTSNHRAA